MARIKALIVSAFLNAIKSYKAYIPIGFFKLKYLFSPSFINNIVIIRLNIIRTYISIKLSRITRRSPVKSSRINILNLIND